MSDSLENSLDSSFDHISAAVKESLDALKSSFQDMHDKFNKYQEESQRANEQLFAKKHDELKNTLVEKMTEKVAEKVTTVRKELADTQEIQKQDRHILETLYNKADSFALKSNLDGLQSHITILTNKELQDISQIEDEMDEFRKNLKNIENNIEDTKARMEKLGATVQRQTELRRSLRLP